VVVDKAAADKGTSKAAAARPPAPSPVRQEHHQQDAESTASCRHWCGCAVLTALALLYCASVFAENKSEQRKTAPRKAAPAPRPHRPRGGGEEQKPLYNLSASATPRPRRFVIVTAASGNHLCQLQQMLASLAAYEHKTTVLVYDLAWTPRLSARWLSRFHPGVREVRWFNYSAHAAIFQKRTNYAWKAAIIKDALDEHASVLWMDAGNRVLAPDGFDAVEKLLDATGFVSAVSGGSIARWTHEGMFAHLGIEKTKDWDTRKKGRNCNGALIGFRRGPDTTAYADLFLPWLACAGEKKCITPHGSSRSNHRQDQAALTLQVYGLTDNRWECTPGLIRKGLVTQQDRQAVNACVKPPKGMDADECGHECYQ